MGEMPISDAGRQAIEAGVSPSAWQRRVDLACLFRIAAHLGREDSINTHSTMRLDGPEHRFLINPFEPRFDEVRASDLIELDIEGNVAGETRHPVNRAG